MTEDELITGSDNYEVYHALFRESLHSPGEYVRGSVRPTSAGDDRTGSGPQRNASADDAQHRRGHSEPRARNRLESFRKAVAQQDELNEAAKRFLNPEQEPVHWWELLFLPFGLLALAGYWLCSLLPPRPRSGAVRCLVPRIQTDPALAKAVNEFTDSLEESP